MAGRIPGARLVEIPGKSIVAGAGAEQMLGEIEGFLREPQVVGRSTCPTGCWRPSS
jgi:hypothetical protein